MARRPEPGGAGTVSATEGAFIPTTPWQPGGLYYRLAVTDTAQLGAQVAVVNKIQLRPFFIPNQITLQAVSFRENQNGGGNWQGAVYEMDATSGLPTALLAAGASTPNGVTGTTYDSLFPVPVLFNPGTYFAACWFDAAVGAACDLTAAQPPLFGVDGTLAVGRIGYAKNLVYGAWPNPLGATTGFLFANVGIDRLALSLKTL